MQGVTGRCSRVSCGECIDDWPNSDEKRVVEALLADRRAGWRVTRWQRSISAVRTLSSSASTLVPSSLRSFHVRTTMHCWHGTARTAISRQVDTYADQGKETATKPARAKVLYFVDDTKSARDQTTACQPVEAREARKTDVG
eukprot:1206696-Pleurochrysis_carterae.AAC.1